MNTALQNDLLNCLKLIDPNWKIQDNKSDKDTNFIYKCNTLKECLDTISKKGADKQYALHRWYNYMTSIECENLFCTYGAVHEQDKCNHDVDIYINNIPFDVKVTVYPAKLSNRSYDLKTRSGKDEMIRWFYANQSQGARKQMVNRLYVVCDGTDQAECLKMKSDFSVLEAEISAFMNDALNSGVNQIQITDEGNVHNLLSDIIYISYN
ncbi:MAG: hypothetical protein K2O44_05920 [Clostridia bacterium]|nr:hypothetical protein [Clostridia bacterium]